MLGDGKAIEEQWLHWFAVNVDFGPAHGDVMIMMQDEFNRQTGLEVPDGWRYDCDEE